MPGDVNDWVAAAPERAFIAERDSLYLGTNLYIQGNDLKVSLGYEIGKGSGALSGPAALDLVTEKVSGFRFRGQLNF